MSIGRADRLSLRAVLLRAGLAGVIATIGVLIEESRVLSGMVTRDVAIGAGTMVAVAVSAPLLVVFSLAVRYLPKVGGHGFRLVAGLSTAAVAAIANQTLYPRLYPTLHLGLAAIALAGCVLAGDAILSAFERAAPVRAGSVSGLLALAMFLVGAPAAARAITRSPMTRTALHEKSELLRPVVRLAAGYHGIQPPPLLANVLDPLAAPATVDDSVDGRGYDILLITVDALRADHVGAYGYSRPTTPNLDALASEGVVFHRAYTAAPQTSYALSSIMTGTHVRAVRNDLPTWPAEFARRGYLTRAFYPETIFYTERRRFAAYETSHFGFKEALVEHATAVTRAERITEFVHELPEGRAFFAWTHIFEPHEPYDAHEEWPFGNSDVDRYDAEIAFADRSIGTIVRNVREARPRTIIVVTADHGEAFGEHASAYHGTTLYEEQVRVPLIVHAPGLLAPARVDRPVQTIDIMPTLARMVGVTTSFPQRGRDLFANDGGVAFASLSEISLLATGTERLICQTPIAVCALFDVEKDPSQQEPVLEGPRVDELRGTLAAVESGNAALSH